MKKLAAYNTGFASGGVTCKLGALCFYSSVVLVDSFVLRNPPFAKPQTVGCNDNCNDLSRMFRLTSDRV